MFIRRTKTTSGKDGKAYYTYRLVKNYRQGDKVRQRTILNLGANFHIEKKYWSLLCDLISSKLKGQKYLLPVDVPQEVREEAERIAYRILVEEERHRRFLGEKAPGDMEEPNLQGEDREYHEVDVNSLEFARPRTVGVEAAGLWAMGQVGFDDILRELGFSYEQIGILKGMIIARMAVPGSELSTYSWLTGHSGLGELIGLDFEAMSIMKLYRVSDKLYKHKDRIETLLFGGIHGLFKLTCTVTLYDLTNSYFEGEVQCNPKARRGHSKDKRTDRPLLTLGLVLDGSGFIRSSRVFAGNVSEVSTLKEVLENLDAPPGAVVVMDRGISSSENIEWLRESGFRYIVVNREQRREFCEDRAICFENKSGQKIKIDRVKDNETGETKLFCYSESRAKKEEGILEKQSKRFEDELNKISQGLSKRGCVRRIDKVLERIGRLKERYKKVAKYYRIEVKKDETGQKATEIVFERIQKAGSMLSHPGVYCLRTNIEGWSSKDLWRTYTMLTDLEGVFRALKSELGLRPVYHRKEERCESHFFITVLAYQFVQIIRKTLSTKGITDSWTTIRRKLSKQVRVTTTFYRKDGKTLNVRKATLLEPEQEKLCNILGLDANPGGTVKLIVP